MCVWQKAILVAEKRRVRLANVCRQDRLRCRRAGTLGHDETGMGRRSEVGERIEGCVARGFGSDMRVVGDCVGWS